MGIFIGLEGIDACGKTTISLTLEEKLNSMGVLAKRIVKDHTEYESNSMSNFTRTLKKLIWDYDDDMLTDVSSQGWLYLHALWYTVLSENLIKKKINEYDVLIVDGWFHKIYSRFLLKKNFNRNLLNVVYDSVMACDKVFMIDASPDVCWQRRKIFKPTEMGGFDFEIDNPKDSFIRYQNNVREQLICISENNAWVIINSDNLDIEELTNKIALNIRSLLVR